MAIDPGQLPKGLGAASQGWELPLALREPGQGGSARPWLAHSPAEGLCPSTQGQLAQHPQPSPGMGTWDKGTERRQLCQQLP